MIVRCIEKALRGGCGGCERAETCAIAQNLSAERRAKTKVKPDFAPLLSFLGAAAKRLESHYRARQSFSATVERTRLFPAAPPPTETRMSKRSRVAGGGGAATRPV